MARLQARPWTRDLAATPTSLGSQKVVFAWRCSQQDAGTWQSFAFFSIVARPTSKGLSRTYAANACVRLWRAVMATKKPPGSAGAEGHPGQNQKKAMEWIENRLEEFAEIFTTGVGGFSVTDNYLHALLRLDRDVAQEWSDEEVVRRSRRLLPPRDKSRQPMPVTNQWVKGRRQGVQWVATARHRLQSLSWLMRCLKEPLLWLANRQDNAR